MMPGTMPSERMQRRIDRFLDQAEEAVENREWDAAQEFCRAALALDGGNEDAQALLSAAQQAIGGVGTVPGLPGPSSDAEQLVKMRGF